MNSDPIEPFPPFRIGEGWDTHALVPGRKLILENESGVVGGEGARAGHRDPDPGR